MDDTIQALDTASPKPVNAAIELKIVHSNEQARVAFFGIVEGHRRISRIEAMDSLLCRDLPGRGIRDEASA